MYPGARLLILAFALMLTGPAAAQEQIERFYGSYVGSGLAERTGEVTREERDLDVTVKAYKDDGFTLKWITVVRGAGGERTGPDVRRREIEENFLPSEGNPNLYILAPKGGLFQKAELPNPLKGEPMRWATIEGETMSVYSLGINDQGRSEMQIYHRQLTEAGLSVDFMRMDDEEVEVRVFGELVRTE